MERIRPGLFRRIRKQAPRRDDHLGNCQWTGQVATHELDGALVAPPVADD
jgi:hypothetical protein